MTSDQRGATLVELLIVTALLSVAVLAASALIIQSAKVISSVGRALTTADVGILDAWLRRDLHATVGVHTGAGRWSAAPMVLSTGDHELISYTFVNSSLQRQRVGQHGEVLDSRAVARGIALWRWREASRVLEVELVSLTANVTGIAVQTGPGSPDAWSRHLKTRLCFSLRAYQGGMAW